MHRFVAAVSAILLACASFSLSQTDTGLPPFAAIQGGAFDTVKISSGSVFLSLPVRTKTGFQYMLTSNVAVGTFNNTYLQIPPVSPLPDWAPSIPHRTSALWTYVGITSDVEANCPGTQNVTDKLTGWYFIDGAGTNHAFPTVKVDTLNCFSEVTGATAADGSGYSLTVNPTGDAATVYDRQGNRYTGGSILNSVTDPNGNTLLSWTGGCIANCSNFGNETDAYTATDELGSNPMTYTITYTNYKITHAVNTWTDAANHSQSYTINYGSQTQKTNFGCAAPYLDLPGGSGQMPSTIVGPEGTYALTYEPTTGGTTGRLAKITFPSGAYIAYQYSGGNNNSGLLCTTAPLGVIVPVLTRTLVDSKGNSRQWKYDTQAVANATVVTDPSGNDTVYQFGASRTGAVTQTQFYQGSRAANVLLKTELTCYNNNTVNCATANVSGAIHQIDVYTTLAGMATSSHVWRSLDNYANVTEIKEYDYVGANPVTDTIIVYAPNGSCSNVGANISDRVCSVTTTDSAGHVMSQTNNSYDVHGNLLSSSRWVSGATGTGNYLTTSATYNTNGTVNVATDVNGAQTTYHYNSAICQGFVPTSVDEPLGLSKSMTWDCNGAVITSLTDENGKVSHVNYANGAVADPFYRPVSQADTLGNTTSFAYSPTTVESALNFNGTISTSDSLVTQDGFGHTIESQTRQSQTSSLFDTVQYVYDVNGRLHSASLPCSTTAGGPCATSLTTQTYDALGRPLLTTDGGGGTTGTTYPQNKNDVLTAVGPAPGIEHTKGRQYEYDGLGRLKSVCEVLFSGGASCGQSVAASGYLTSYAYSVLPSGGGSQMTVTQGVQTRTFVRDGLGRLVSETNPESGTTTYLYDIDGADTCGASGRNSYGDLVRKTDSNGNYTCYVYDSLHRVTGVGNNFDNAANPCRRFRYDNTMGVLGAIPAGVTISNPMGHLVEAETDTCVFPVTAASQLTDEWFSYSNRGENTDAYEWTPHTGSSTYYHTTAAFWANGALQSLSGIPGYSTTSYGVDGEGRPSTAQQGTTKIVCDSSCTAASTTFDPAGNPLAVKIGGTTDSDAYTYYSTTERMHTYTFTVGSTPKSIAGTLNWNQNGSLQQLAITDGFNAGGAQTCNFGTASVVGYDDLGRLVKADCGSAWSQTFTYDQYGNGWKTGSLAWACQTCYGTNNRYNTTLSALISYDAAGNLLNDTFHKYTWDVYGGLATIGSPTGTVTCGSSGICLTYDAFGKMIEKNVAGVYTQILYSPVGKTATMSGQTTSQAYIPLPAGETLYQSGATGGNRVFWHKDWLGTVRFASALGTRTSTYDRAYAPFGEMYDNFGTTTTPDFTGDTADTVSDLFDTPNREYHANQGRWISPDPGGYNVADPSNPQSWNRYAYVMNNPLSSIDPTGLACYFIGSADCTQDSGWTGNGGTCDPIGDSECVFDARTPWYINRQSGKSGFSFGFDVAPGFGSGGGSGIWDEWQAPMPTNLGDVYQSVWSDVLELPSGLDCPEQGGIFSPLCGGVSPLMDAGPANNGPCGGADCTAVRQSMLQMLWKPQLAALERFICKRSAKDRVLISIRNGAMSGAATGTWAGSAVGGIGAIPGGVLGTITGAGNGATRGSAVAAICFGAGMYD